MPLSFSLVGSVPGPSTYYYSGTFGNAFFCTTNGPLPYVGCWRLDSSLNFTQLSSNATTGIVVANNKIWLYDFTGEKVTYSTDGVNFSAAQTITFSGGGGLLGSEVCFSINGQIFIYTDDNGVSGYSVYRSSNGINFTEVAFGTGKGYLSTENFTTSATTLRVYPNGISNGAVFYVSSDGVNYTSDTVASDVTSGAIFPRFTTYSGNVYAITGDVGGVENDVFMTTDGKNFSRQASNVLSPLRNAPFIFSVNSSLYIGRGNSAGPVFNYDIYIAGAVSSTTKPTIQGGGACGMGGAIERDLGGNLFCTATIGFPMNDPNRRISPPGFTVDGFGLPSIIQDL